MEKAYTLKISKHGDFAVAAHINQTLRQRKSNIKKANYQIQLHLFFLNFNIQISHIVYFKSSQDVHYVFTTHVQILCLASEIND